MKYKYENSVINELEELEDEYKISYKNEIDEVRKVYRKAKVFDKVRSFITKRLKEEETTDEYDYGERFMCEEIKRLLEDEYMNKGLYETIREKAFEVGNESTVIKYENKGNNQHEIVITYDEETEYEVSDVVLEYSNTEDKNNE